MDAMHRTEMPASAEWSAVVEACVDAAAARLCGDSQTSHEECMALARELHERESDALGAFANALRLSVEQQLALRIAAAYELDTRLALRLDSLSQGDGLSVGALVRVAYPDDPGRGFEEVDEAGPLFRTGLLSSLDRDRGLARRRISVAPRLLMLVSRRVHEIGLDARIKPLLTLDPIVGDVKLIADADSQRLAREALRSASVTVVHGAPGSGRRTLLATVVATQLRTVARECRLLGRVPLLCNIDALVDEKDTSRLDLVGSELVSLIDGPVLVTCGVNRPRLDWGRPVIVVEMGQPTTAQRATLWHQALGQGTAEDAELLATRYPLAPALIVRAAEAAKARAHGRTLEPEDIYAGIRAVLDDRLGQFAKRVTVTQTWDDLVLPQEQVDAIVELMARIRERRRVYEEWGFAAKVGKGLGVSALFSGPPGTGKTMVAALIARDLGLELYQVDVSKVVSKYIGETEKNLAALFDAAEAGHAVLLFDEADALFGKRTDVKSSNDRYANLETNYLLQRLESFTGICLLTSNHESHIDIAFQRRLSLHLRFELPDAEQRAELWRAMLPDAAPVERTLDLEALGRRYAMSGGYIRNAALRAAFLAANDGTAITAMHLERAARLEYEGMGKIASN